MEYRTLGNSGLLVIAGASTAEQVRANAAAGQWVPTPEELAKIDTVLDAQPAAG